jgi:hypothetical protein
VASVAIGFHRRFAAPTQGHDRLGLQRISLRVLEILQVHDQVRAVFGKNEEGLFLTVHFGIRVSHGISFLISKIISI